MKTQSHNIIAWILTAIVVVLLVVSATKKMIGSAGAIKLASSIGLSPELYRTLGIVELLSVILFTIPRTGVIGTLLLSAYFGGAIATQLEYHEHGVIPVV